MVLVFRNSESFLHETSHIQSVHMYMVVMNKGSKCKEFAQNL